MSEESEPRRRNTHIAHRVVYAEVGASAAPDLLRFPPEGSSPYAEEVRLGSGADRFVTASSLLMTWGAQRGAGISVTELERGDGGHYDGVVFDGEGIPQPAANREDRFGPDGEPFLTAGTSLRISVESPKRPDRLMRVVYTIDEPRRIGFAWGNADSDGVVGEEVFIVEHRDDDTVWASVRGFVSAPASGLLGVKGRAAVKQAVQASRDQIASLVPGGGAAQNGASLPDRESESRGEGEGELLDESESEDGRARNSS